MNLLLQKIGIFKMLMAIELLEFSDNLYSLSADQIIVATARIFNSPLVIYDSKILNYQHVKLLP